MMNNEINKRWNNLLNGLEYKVKGSVLTQEEIRTFEKNNEIVLPEDYRYFLMNVGNGIVIKNGIYDLVVGYLERPIEKNINKRLKLEFPFQEQYKLSDDYPEYYYKGRNFKDEKCLVAETKLDYKDDVAIEKCRECPYVNECNDADWQVFYDEKFDGYLKEGSVPYHNGSLVICDMGFEDIYRLILTGEHKGEIWLNVWGTEFIPITKSFYDFLLAYKNKDSILKDKDYGSLWRF